MGAPADESWRSEGAQTRNNSYTNSKKYERMHGRFTVLCPLLRGGFTTHPKMRFEKHGRNFIFENERKEKGTAKTVPFSRMRWRAAKETAEGAF